MTDLAAPATATRTPGSALRRLYLVRFVFAIVWAAVLLLASPGPGPLLVVLVLIYPLVDAASVGWQLRTAQDGSSRIAEWFNLVLSVAAAIALGVAATMSAAAVLAVWGGWAIVSGIAQLVAAILRRRSGGQVPLIISGAISVLAGGSFGLQGLQGGTNAASVGGYAVLGGIFFLISAIRLSIVLRRNA